MARRLYLALVGLLTATAHADDVPRMATLDRASGESWLRLEASFVRFDSDGLPPSFSWARRFELYGQSVLPSGLGGYASLMHARAWGIAPLGYASAYQRVEVPSMGNPELGGIYARGPIVLRAGMTLPARWIETNSATHDEARLRTSAARLTDSAAMTYRAWYARVAASFVGRSGPVFVRADAGVDYAVGDGALWLRLNAGAGVVLGPIVVSLESANVLRDSRHGRSAALAIRYRGDGFEPFIAAGVTHPTEPDEPGAWFVTGGVDVAAP